MAEPTSPNPNGNPFDTLASDGTQPPVQPASSASSNGNPFDALATTNAQADTGEITNDVGQKVIVPKDGEAFSDTVKRAIQYHKSLTPEQQQAALNAESSTIPAKTAQTLGAAAGIGVAGPALLAVPGEVADFAIKHLAGNVLPGMESEAAKQTLIRAIPKVVEFAKTMGTLGFGAGGVGYLIKTLLGDGKK